MSKQQTLLNFFKPQAVKRTFSSDSNEGSKKLRISDENDPCQDETYEQKAKVKLASLAKELSVLDTTIGASWFYALENEFSKPYFKQLNDYVNSERSKFKVYPARENVWTWTKMCKISQVKVVILGQDPYHNPGQAHGLCFSVPKNFPLPPSLVNIYKELQSDIEGFLPPKNGDLTGWAKQGVLLLNSSLTVRENAPASHAGQGWEKITDAVIKYISDRNKGVVFLLWGSHAQKKAACVNQKRHHLLKTVHPSPLSAHRGFFGCKHFSKCNKLLQDEGKEPVDWKKLD